MIGFMGKLLWRKKNVYENLIITVTALSNDMISPNQSTEN